VPLPSPQEGQFFPNTSWSLIHQSQDVANPEAMAALNDLARAYWRPLVVYATRSGLDHAEAQDEVQRVFEKLFSRESLRYLRPSESRFRAFLIQCLRNSMASSHRDQARRRPREVRLFEPPMEFTKHDDARHNDLSQT
jgi:RNA polymerase sigma factor (sigma-70 family)